MKRHLSFAALTVGILTGSGYVQAQQIEWTPRAFEPFDRLEFGTPGQQFELLIAEPLEEESLVTNAPFSAEAINEFTQVLADGNRIERRFATSLWRDSQGRTRREQQIALVGPLAIAGEPPRMVTISDPVAKVSYTLDAQTKTANRAGAKLVRSTTMSVSRAEAGRGVAAVERNDQDVVVFHSGASVQRQVLGGALFEATAPPPARVEQLGTSVIGGVEADGTRTTMTIPAGAMGNIAPIDIVSERWFSKELQTAVLLTRRDPRSGDTVYRLTNIVRAEPSPDLFTVPADYRVSEAYFNSIHGTKRAK